MSRRLATLSLSLVALFVAGCGGGGTNTAPKPEIYFINASPDSVSLDYRMDDSAFETGVAYLGSSAAFRSIDFRGPDVEGWDVSTHVTSSGLELDRQAIIFSEDTDYLIVTHGLLTPPVGEQLKRLRVTQFTVDRRAPIGNKARLIVFHGLEREPGKSTPAVVFQDAVDQPQFSSGTIQPGAQASFLVDTGTRTWFVKRDGTDGQFVSGSFSFAPGNVYAVIISGVENDANPAKQPKITAIPLPTVQ
ncbi:hypothetical protein QPK87_05325 [Kamptonema cortianum]|nr:hypothetical protein [Geitlerinema splendidum]MDK3155998.1 hypothetical protein [Kamptonema cortianum]